MRPTCSTTSSEKPLQLTICPIEPVSPQQASSPKLETALRAHDLMCGPHTCIKINCGGGGGSSGCVVQPTCLLADSLTCVSQRHAAHALGNGIPDNGLYERRNAHMTELLQLPSLKGFTFRGLSFTFLQSPLTSSFVSGGLQPMRGA